MKISVLGCGRWGSFHAWYCGKIGHDVTLYGRANSKNMQRLESTGGNDYLKLPENVELTKDLEYAVHTSNIIIISVGAQSLRGLLQEIRDLYMDVREKKFVLCMKGLEKTTGKRLSTIFAETLESQNVAVWVGPGHVQDLVQSIPNCMVIAAMKENLAEEMVEVFKSPLIRFYYGTDLIGIEIGAAAKNVVGIAAGMLDGLKCTSLKGALMARGTAELSRLVESLGGDRMSIYGLSHLGDYEATLFSNHSHNRKFGEDFVQNKQFDKLAEGTETVVALMKLSKITGVELPICRAVYNILYENAEPEEQLMNLFMRSTKIE